MCVCVCVCVCVQKYMSERYMHISERLDIYICAYILK